MMKIIRVFGSSIGVVVRCSELDKDNEYGVKYKFTENDDYTHAIIINTCMPELIVQKENVIGLSFEPPKFLGLNDIFIEYVKKHIGRYYIGKKGNLPYPFIERYSCQWHTKPLTFTPIKNKLMSIVCSKKMYAPGHIYRHELIKCILKTNLPIDIYGRGCVFYHNDDRIKGKFKKIEPYETYKFHIAIENFSLPHYFSEKIVNSLLCSSIPIYLGCQNIDSYFDNTVIKLTGNVHQDMELLKNICNNFERYKKTIDLDSVKKTISIKNIINDLK